jgi:hypothetical protein
VKKQREEAPVTSASTVGKGIKKRLIPEPSKGKKGQELGTW